MESIYNDINYQPTDILNWIEIEKLNLVRQYDWVRSTSIKTIDPDFPGNDVNFIISNTTSYIFRVFFSLGILNNFVVILPVFNTNKILR